MKSKKEIEDYLGMKIEPYYITEVESIYGEEQVAYDRYVMGQRIPANYRKEKALPKETEDVLKKLIKESIEKNDMETATTCHSILIDNTSSFRDVKSIDGLNEDQIAELMKYEQEQNDKSKREWEEEPARLKAEQETKEQAEEQARLKAEQEAKEQAEEQAKLKAEQEAKEQAEEQARLKAEQEAKEQAEEQARLKAEREAKEQAEEQARLKAEREAKEKAEEQARLKAEQEAKEKAEQKERQASIDKDIAEYEQYEELISRKPELDKLLEELKYEEFSSTINKYTSQKMEELLNDLKKLPQEERKIILQQYNKLADLKINEQGDVIRDVKQQDNLNPERQDIEQESKKTEQAVEDYWKEIHAQQARVYEQPQPEKVRTIEKSIKDEVGDELRKTEQHTQKQDNPSVDLWLNRFSGWYSAIDRVSQSVKDKFVKMKSDIVKAISETLKERNNHREANTQKQDSKER